MHDFCLQSRGTKAACVRCAHADQRVIIAQPLAASWARALYSIYVDKEVGYNLHQCQSKVKHEVSSGEYEKDVD